MGGGAIEGTPRGKANQEQSPAVFVAESERSAYHASSRNAPNNDNRNTETPTADRDPQGTPADQNSRQRNDHRTPRKDSTTDPPGKGGKDNESLRSNSYNRLSKCLFFLRM